MQPFKVTFKLASPLYINNEYPIHLDALLAYACVQDLEAQGVPDSWSQVDSYMKELGILDHTSGDQWVWKASKLFVDACSEIQFANQIRKSDPDMYFDEMFDPIQNPSGVWVTGYKKDGSIRAVSESTFKINTASGQHRGYQWLNASQWVNEITAFGIGDIDTVSYYLNEYIKYVGKVGRNGFGRVASISVTPHDCPDDWRMRILPLSEEGKEGEVYANVQACIRAPYWNKLQRVIAKEIII